MHWQSGEHKQASSYYLWFLLSEYSLMAQKNNWTRSKKAQL